MSLRSTTIQDRNPWQGSRVRVRAIRERVERFHGDVRSACGARVLSSSNNVGTLREKPAEPKRYRSSGSSSVRAAVENVRIDHRRRHIAMSEFLNRADVVAVVKQMRCETVGGSRGADGYFTRRAS